MKRKIGPLRIDTILSGQFSQTSVDSFISWAIEIDIGFQQGIFEIEDGAFFEDEQHAKLFARGAETFRLANVLVVLESTAMTFREEPYVCLCINTLQLKSCTPLRFLRYSFTYVHAVAFLRINHALDSGRGDDEATGNTQPSRKYFCDSGDIVACNHAFGT